MVLFIVPFVILFIILFMILTIRSLSYLYHTVFFRKLQAHNGVRCVK